MNEVNEKKKSITTEEILKKVSGIEILGRNYNDEFVEILIPKDKVLETLKTLKQDRELKLDNLHCLSGVDYIDHMEVVYHLFSFDTKHKVVAKTRLTREDSKVDSIVSLWNVADFMERETFELYGIEFVGHPNLKRLLLTDDFPGFPYRKDYPMKNDEEWLLDDGHKAKEYGLPEDIFEFYKQHGLHNNGGGSSN